VAGLLENYAAALEIDGRARDIRARHAIQNPRR